MTTSKFGIFGFLLTDLLNSCGCSACCCWAWALVVVAAVWTGCSSGSRSALLGWTTPHLCWILSSWLFWHCCQFHYFQGCPILVLTFLSDSSQLGLW